jgi:glucokinase
MNPPIVPGAIGIDIGGTRVKAVVVSARGDVLSRTQTDTGDFDDSWQDEIVRIVKSFEDQFGPIPAIGVSAPGIGRPDESGISWMIGRMASVVNFDFTAHLGRSNRVPVLNDALAALLGEAWLGAARGVADAVLLTLGTGVGGAIMCGGRLLKGHTGRAGHLGHITVDSSGPLDICNTPGSIEYAIGNYSLDQRSKGQLDSTEALVRAYESGDELASEIWRDSIRKLAAGIASIINIVDPQRIIIGGGIARAGESLFKPLLAELARFEWRPVGSGVEIVPAELGEWAGAIGAAGNVMRAIGN